MRIAEVEVIPYALPFKRPYVTARGTLERREMVLLRLRTDGGHRRPRRGRAAVAARRRDAAPGRAVAGPRGQAPGQAGRGGDGREQPLAAAVDAVIHVAAGRRLPAPAKAAVEMALFDLAGRISGTPLWRMLRGETSAPLRCNATLAAGSPHRARRRGGRLERARLRDLQAQARDRRRRRTGAGGPRRRWARMRACEWTPTAPGAPIRPWPCWTRSSRSGSSWSSSPPRPFGRWPPSPRRPRSRSPPTRA